MVLVNGKRKPVLLTVFGVLLLIFSAATLIREIPVLGYDSVLEDPRDSWPTGLRSLMEGPYSLETFYPRTGVLIDNMIIHVQNGDIVSMDFHLKLKNGFQPANITNARIHLMGDFISNYYSLINYSGKESSLNVSILEDPAGRLTRGFLDEDSSLIVTIKARIGHANNPFWLYYEPIHGRSEGFNFFPPRYINESLYGEERPFHVNVDDIDGTYPQYPDNAWVIANRTIMENQTVNLDKDLLIIQNGTLELRNSTILVNASVERYFLFRMNSTFEAHLQNRTIDEALEQEFFRHNITISLYPSMILNQVADDVWKIGSNRYVIKRTEFGLDVYETSNNYENRNTIYVSSEGRLLISNSIVASTGNWTIPISIWESGYDIEVFGQAIIEGSVICATNVTYSKFSVHSDDVRISNSTIGMTVDCSYGSPTITNNYFPHEIYPAINLFVSNAFIENNSFGNPRSQGTEGIPQIGDGIRVGSGNPVITGNIFNSMHKGIEYAWCYDFPLIHNNHFNNIGTAFILYHTTAEIKNNSINNSSTGILFDIGSEATIEHNMIWSKEPIKVLLRSNATIVNNSISDYEQYGIYSYESQTTINQNEYNPNQNNLTTSYGFYQEWGVDIEVFQEKQGHREPMNVDIRIWSPKKPDNPISTKSVESDNRLKIRVPEFIISNQGKRIDLAPYKLTVGQSFWQTTFDIDIKRSARYEDARMTVVFKEKSYDYPFRVIICFVGFALITCASALLIRYYRQKKLDLTKNVNVIIHSKEID
jgi:hypothetical protein